MAGVHELEPEPGQELTPEQVAEIVDDITGQTRDEGHDVDDVTRALEAIELEEEA